MMAKAMNDTDTRAREGGEGTPGRGSNGGGSGARPDQVPHSDQSTFAPGLRALPRAVRADVARLYKVLRTLDDLVDDDSPEAPARLESVERWARGWPADSPEARTLSDL